MSAHSDLIIAIDQGTTSSRTIVFDSSGNEITRANKPVSIKTPKSGWVEQDANEIWSSQLETLHTVSNHIDTSTIKAIGITNQRETLIVWDRNSGEPLAPAIVWQCRRTSEICERLKIDGCEESIIERTGLVLDPYFSATKALWLMENIPQVSKAIKSGSAIFGTVDSWLLYNLTKSNDNPSFFTEPSNASRTMLFSLEDKNWNKELCDMFSLKHDNLPEVLASNALFGTTSLLGPDIPIHAILGDQQAALYGHGCTEINTAKCTFGTGAFMLANCGETIKRSKAGLLSTVAWSLEDTPTTYALEGSVFIAGALIEWLRDNLGIIKTASQSEELAASVPDSHGVSIVPAFVGLGAPYWDEHARGIISGLTRGTTQEHIARAALEAVAHQVADLFEAESFQIFQL